MKRVKITRPSKPKPEQLPSKTFYIRHDRFFTLLGFFVILATFIAKEVVVEHLKELSATVSSAQSSYYPRVDQIFDTSYHTLWPANANTVRQEAKNTVENCRKT